MLDPTTGKCVGRARVSFFGLHKTRSMVSHEILAAVQTLCDAIDDSPEILKHPELQRFNAWLERRKAHRASESGVDALRASAGRSAPPSDEEGAPPSDEEGAPPSDEEGEEEAWLLDIEALTAAIRLEPAAHHYATRGFAFLKRGRLQDALGDANRALQINSDSARAYLLRAKTHWELRNHTDAYSDMCQAQRIDYNEEHDDLHQMMRRAGQRKRPGKRPVRGEGDEYPDLYPSTVARSPTVKMYLPVPASGPMSPAMEPFHYICSFSELTDSKTVIRNIVLALNHEYQEAYSLHQTINEATTLQIADDYPFLGAFINQPDERESANLCFVDPNEWIDRIGNRYENVPLAIHNAASLPMQHLDLLQRQALVATSNIEAGTELMLSYGRDSVRPRLRYR